MSVVKDGDLETMPTSIFLNDDDDDDNGCVTYLLVLLDLEIVYLCIKSSSRHFCGVL